MSRWTYHLPILGYHRVGEFKGDHVPTVSPQAFEWQLDYLARHRYQVLSLDAVVGLLERGGPFPQRCVVITFDDGYEETHRIAWPLLKARRFPAAVFVTPNEVGLTGFASWQQVVEMSRDGITIGSHTMNHVYLPLAQENRLNDEIAGSKRVIEERISEPIRFLSYPVGGFTPLVSMLARKAGYRAACTTNRSVSGHQLDLMALRRIKITERDRNPVLFAAKLSGYYDLFRRLKTPS